MISLEPYRGYSARAALDEAAGILHGEVINLRDVITFEATSAWELQQAFAASVDDYLAFCAERGEEPARPFSFHDFEGCVAYFKANPPEGGKVELEFAEEEIQHIREKAAQYECTVDVFLAAVVGCFLTELA